MHEYEPFVEPSAPASGQHLAAFAIELEAYENRVGVMEQQLHPVTEQVDEMSKEAASVMIEAAPTHDLHALILRLERINRRLTYLSDRIRL